MVCNGWLLIACVENLHLCKGTFNGGRVVFMSWVADNSVDISGSYRSHKLCSIFAGLCLFHFFEELTVTL